MRYVFLIFILLVACGEKPAFNVNGDKVTKPQWEALQRHYSVTNEAAQKRFSGELVDTMLLAQEAERRKLDREPLTAALAEQQRRQQLAAALRAQVASEIKDDDVRAYYAANVSQHTRVLYDLHQIVARFDPGDAKAERAAQERIDRAFVALRSGVAFPAVAATQTDDISARANGGAIGKVSLEDVPQELRATVQQLAKGQFSQPVKSRYGLHILYLAAEPEQVVQPYERLAANLRSELAEKRLAETLERLRKAADIKTPE